VFDHQEAMCSYCHRQWPTLMIKRSLSCLMQLNGINHSVHASAHPAPDGGTHFVEGI
jgi:hypothetical protein